MRVEPFERFWVVGIGAVLMAGLAALLVFSVRDQVGQGSVSLFALSILFAPIFLVGMSVAAPSGTWAVPAWLVVTSLLSVASAASHPFVPRPATVVMSMLGFAAWALCMLLVAGSII